MRFDNTRPRRSVPPKLARFSGDVLAQLARRTRFVDPALCRDWSEIVGAEIAALCRPGRINGPPGRRKIELIARGGAESTAAQMKSDEILSALRRYLGPGAIDGLTFRRVRDPEETPLALSRFAVATQPADEWD